ncbi:MAG: DUF192 domain-containing protein [Deltaproteobacteria bacterium]|nr:DUF192 domain-containing protein [Deltaproteobacteria bacterium]
MSIRNVTRGTVLADRERWAVTGADRARGLLDSDGLEPGEALIISPCNSVHMFGMRFALDVIFVDRDGLVLRAITNLKPLGFTRLYLRAQRAIELPVGVIAQSQTEPGDQLDLGTVPSGGAGSSLLPWAFLVTSLVFAILLWFFS